MSDDLVSLQTRLTDAEADAAAYRLALEVARLVLERYEPCGYYCNESVGHVDHPATSTVVSALTARTAGAALLEEDYQAYLNKGRIQKPMTIYEGQTNDKGELLLLDKWANKPLRRVRVWRLTNGDVRIEFVDNNIIVTTYATLTSYRAADLAKALAKTTT